MLKLFVLAILSLLSTTVGAAADSGVVHHPSPKKPLYVAEDFYDTLKKQIPLPPAADSAKQKSDETELRRLQKLRTEAECRQAKNEILVSLKSFFGAPDSPIPAGEIDALSPFFEQMRNDADYFVQKLKIDFPRRRPFEYLEGIEPCVAKEVTGSYPSGHAVLSKLFSLALIEIYPAHERFLAQRAATLADHRVLVGIHHRSDVEAGQALAGVIYDQFKKSDRFRKDFAAAKLAIKKS